MKTEKIQYSNIPIKPSFKAGKVRVFSDFDRTFLPARQNQFKGDYDIRFVEYIRKYFKDFKDFLANTREGLKFSITTGRTFGEFQTMAEISRERKFGMPLPDTLIVKNGSDEHLKTGSDEEYYNGGNYPFKYEVTNKEKEEKIKQETGWDGPKIKEKLKEIFKSYNLRIVEADSEHSPRDYGSRSLFSEGKLPYETGRVFEGTDKADWSVGLRNDGNLKIFVTYPYDMLYVEERFKADQDLYVRINEMLKQTGAHQTHRKSHDHASECGERPIESIEPNVCLNSRGLTKLYDTREAVKEARKNNDLVITAGDSSNDFDMLNPGMYLEEMLSKELKEKYRKRFTDRTISPKWLVETMDKDPELTKAFMDLPFAGIIIKRKDEKNSLASLRPFTEGKYQKLVMVDEGHLKEGIQEAIKLYCKQNPAYEKKLSPDLRKQIGPDNDDGNNPRQ